MADVKLVKIQNPMFIARIAPMIQKFAERVNLPNLSYEGLVHVLHNRAQFGGSVAEVWIAQEDNEYLGWASWRVCDAPLVGTVYLDYIYTKGNRKDVSRAFAEQFTQFAEQNNSVWLAMDVIKSGKLLEHFKNIASELDFEIKINPWFPCLATKVDYYKDGLKEK